MLTFDNLILRQGEFTLSASFQVPAHHVTAIIGPSGAGKSTLLAAVAGFLRPASGALLWNDVDITARSPSERTVSVLFQDNNLFPHLTVSENVGLALRSDLKLSHDQVKNVSRALVDVGLTEMELRKPSALSGGQQSRAALARVLLANKDILLLDEPFAALGPGLKSEMLSLVKSKLSMPGKTVLMVTHDPQDAHAIADYVILVAEGKAMAPIRTKTLFDNPPDTLKDYLGSA